MQCKGKVLKSQRSKPLSSSFWTPCYHSMWRKTGEERDERGGREEIGGFQAWLSHQVRWIVTWKNLSQIKLPLVLLILSDGCHSVWSNISSWVLRLPSLEEWKEVEEERHEPMCNIWQGYLLRLDGTHTFTDERCSLVSQITAGLFVVGRQTRTLKYTLTLLFLTWHHVVGFGFVCLSCHCFYSYFLI